MPLPEELERAVELRPETDGDRDLLIQLYAASRADELALVGWDEAQEKAFLAMQFGVRDRAYADRHPGSARSVIEVAGRPVGRLWIDDQPDEICIVDIALLPDARNKGVGSRILGDIIRDASARGLPVALHVANGSPARRLYERLGFEEMYEDAMYVQLVRRPDQEKTAS